MSYRFLPYGRQVIESDDIAAVARVLQSDYLTTGPEVPAFEQLFAESVNAPHAVACNSGTSALHLAAMAIGLNSEAAAVVPSITFLATANAVRLTGAEVVFADVDPGSGLMTPATAKAAIARATKPVKAIFPVHLGGQTADIAAIAALAEQVGAVVIEDACHALGTSYCIADQQFRVGACAHSVAAAFSLHPVKTIAAGEGGVVTFRDPDLRENAAKLRNHGMIREGNFRNADLAYGPDGTLNPWYYEMPEVGYNYRLTDFQAALAANQLKKLPRFADVRSRLAAHYDRLLERFAGVLRPVTRNPGSHPVWHLYQILVDFSAIGFDRATLMQRLRNEGIGTQVHYIPVHRQPYYAARYPDTVLPGADDFYSRTMSLPLFASMTTEDVERVISALDAILGQRPDA